MSVPSPRRGLLRAGASSRSVATGATLMTRHSFRPHQLKGDAHPAPAQAPARTPSAASLAVRTMQRPGLQLPGCSQCLKRKEFLCWTERRHGRGRGSALGAPGAQACGPGLRLGCLRQGDAGGPPRGGPSQAQRGPGRLLVTRPANRRPQLGAGAGRWEANHTRSWGSCKTQTSCRLPGWLSRGGARAPPQQVKLLKSASWKR